jgi:hypothetical protein
LLFGSFRKMRRTGPADGYPDKDWWQQRCGLDPASSSFHSARVRRGKRHHAPLPGGIEFRCRRGPRGHRHAIEKAVIFDDEESASPPPKAGTADPIEIERADVASARATQWTERVPKAVAAKSREPVPDLETAVRSGNVQDMTASFLADLLGDDD